MSNKSTALTFDASTIAPQTTNEIIPPGWYIAEISDAEVKATKGRAAGKAAAFEFTILSPEAKGRKVFANINVQNANAQAQEIGQRELSAICHAVGIINVSDLQAFIGKQLQVKVKTRKAKPEEIEKGYEDRSEPGGFKALEGAAVGGSAPAMGAPPAPPMAPATPPAPPAPPAAPVVPTFPPVGWQANPNAPGWFWNPATGEQKTEADLRAASVPAAPPAPAPAPATPTPPPAAPVVDFPPAGWVANPNAPGWYYNPATGEQKDEAALRAAAPVAPAAPAAPVAGSTPPWKQG